jgi:hypothetical protein
MKKMELAMIQLIYTAYEPSPLTPVLYDNVNSYESFNGLIRESYYGIFCSSLITRFGKLKISDGGTLDDYERIESYLKSRITYEQIIGVTTINHGRYGPFYLVTHIDGVPVINAEVSGKSYYTLYNSIQRNVGGREKYTAYIEDCIKQRLIVDKEGILERIMAEPEYYPTAVAILVKGLPMYEHFPVLEKEESDIYFHIFGLLVRKKLL